MKIKNTLLFLLGGLTFFAGNAQEKNKMFSLSEFYVRSGSYFENIPQFRKIDFDKLAPNSELWTPSMFEDDYYDNYFWTTPYSTIGVGLFINRHKEQKFTPELRIGIGYMAGMYLSNASHSQSSSRTDTFVSNSTGQAYYLDTFVSSNTRISHRYDQIRLDASLIFNSNWHPRWTLYGGLGLSYGTSLSRGTEVTYWENEGSRFYPASDPTPAFHNYFYGTQSDFKRETFENQSNNSIMVYVPLGISFKLSKKNEFFNKVNLVMESNVGLVNTSFPEEGRRFTNLFTQNSIGIRVIW